MKNLIRITVLFGIIVMGVFVVRCSTNTPQETTTTDSTEAVVDSVAAPADSVAAQ